MQSIRILTGSLLSIFLSSVTSPAWAGYLQTNLVANNSSFEPQIVDPLVQNAWGLSLRAAGLGGHWWVTNANTGTVTTYVGDVGGTPLFQDDLQFVTIPPSPNAPPETLSEPTGQFFSPHSSDFEVTMPLEPNDPGSEVITGPARFFAVELGGTLSAWTETEGGTKRPVEYLVVADNSEFAPQNTDADPSNDNSAIYFGMTGTTLPSNNRLFAADFDDTPGIHVWDKDFNDVTSSFPFINPFSSDYAPFNIEQLDGTLYVAYAKQSGTPGEEETGLGFGGLAQFDINGNLLNIWETPETSRNLLNAPWGMAIAPDDFGELSNALLVGNFRDGRIVGFDQTTREAIGYLEDTRGNPLEIDGLWDLSFGNGESLGEANHLYFAAGPNDETDGLFGSLQSVPEPTTGLLTFLGVTGIAWVSKITKKRS
ncbi:TIGR03118 family protein [Crocosphaera sp. XPORK-15E]|uniref:TIGR03118 family protein n=1 Tax=Crocosphaera sp. XPORK-15E TaxID=3110247 RepID=UPI002B21CEE7|nr:TIGR03118 family protein [Crocosphaera sp. XPORK-15E]MEA5536154.1 TIGR03118 family protein [Crocosphaera sp. XPORK-15E]